MKNGIKCFTGTSRLSEKYQSIENITKSANNFASTFVNHHLLPDMSFNGHCLIKSNISIPRKVIHLYISYTLGPQLRNLSIPYLDL